MRKVLCCAIGLSLLTAATAFAGGYRVTVQSPDMTAKAGANIASASGADVAYTNPAGAAWVQNGWLAQVDMTYIYLGSARYDDARTGDPRYGGINFSGNSTEGHFFLPTAFVLSPNWNGLRIGFSCVTPYGLTFRWNDKYPNMYNHKFALQISEFNPTATYAITDKFSVAGGARLVYATATVINVVDKSMGPVALGQNADASRGMNGMTTEWGYNLAADFKPTKEMNLAVTFRSRVDLDFTGDVILRGQMYNQALPGGYVFGNPYGPYPNVLSELRTRGSVSTPVPAVLAFSGSYDFGKTTVELTIDRTYWSALKDIQFKMNGADAHGNPNTGNPILDGFAAHGSYKTMDWQDSWSVRLGLEYEATKALTLMAGLAYDESPVRDYSVGFELPDSDSWVFSIGARYAFTNNLEAGLGVLFDKKMTNVVRASDNNPQVNGRFSDMLGIVVSAGVQYKF